MEDLHLSSFDSHFTSCSWSHSRDRAQIRTPPDSRLIFFLLHHGSSWRKDKGSNVLTVL